jgi:hypothetical protein
MRPSRRLETPFWIIFTRLSLNCGDPANSDRDSETDLYFNKDILGCGYILAVERIIIIIHYNNRNDYSIF